MRKIELKHSPDKYPLLENYSGWELVDVVTVRDKIYERALPIYCSDDAETWSVDFPLNLGTPEEVNIVRFKIEATSAQSILGAVGLFQKEYE